jgi:hypothetical protein
MKKQHNEKRAAAAESAIRFRRGRARFRDEPTGRRRKGAVSRSEWRPVPGEAGVSEGTAQRRAGLAQGRGVQRARPGVLCPVAVPGQRQLPLLTANGTGACPGTSTPGHRLPPPLTANGTGVRAPLPIVSLRDHVNGCGVPFAADRICDKPHKITESYCNTF